MSEEITYEVIKNTQDILGKYIKKPPLTEKLLRKPPFRFLHDIVTSVIRETQFLDGIFTDEELKSDNIKDKEDKMRFLQKLINALKLLTESELNVRPSKIVAGHEPVKTNELLQAIGKALDNNLSSAVLVSQLTEGLDLSKQIKMKPPKTKTETKTEKPKHKRDSTPNSRTSLEDKPRKKQETKKKDPIETESKAIKRTEVKTIEKKLKKVVSPTKPVSEKHVSNNNKNAVSLKSQEVIKKRALEKQKSEEFSVDSPKLPPGFDLNDLEPTNDDGFANKESIQDTVTKENEIFREFRSNSTIENIVQNSSLEKINEDNVSSLEEMQQLQSLSDKMNSDSTKPLEDNQEKPIMHTEIARAPTAKLRTANLRPPSARPVSARPAAPRVRERNDVLLPPEQIVPLGKVKVIVENFDKTQEEDDKESLVVVETASIIPDIEPPDPSLIKENAQGHLVTQILETQKELVTDVSKSPVEIEWEADGQRIKETKKRYIDNIRNKIQTVTRAALPLGQIINFLQEDYDNIMRELQIWRSTNAKLSTEIAQQRLLADKNLEPLQKQYQETIEDIEKQKTRNDALKSEIFRNQKKIENVLTTLI